MTYTQNKQTIWLFLRVEKIQVIKNLKNRKDYKVMPSEHTFWAKKTNPTEDSRGEQSKKHSREASSPERARDIVEGETVPTEV